MRALTVCAKEVRKNCPTENVVTMSDFM